MENTSFMLSRSYMLKAFPPSLPLTDSPSATLVLPSGRAIPMIVPESPPFICKL